MSTTYSKKAPVFLTGLFLGGGYVVLAVLISLTTPRPPHASVPPPHPQAEDVKIREVRENHLQKRTSFFFTPELAAGNPATAAPSRGTEEGVIRRSRIEPGSDHIENIFYSNNQVIARQKISGGKIIEETGSVPDGKVKFFDAPTDTYGEEYYKNGKRTHFSRSYYEDGRLKSEANYQNGKLMNITEYYHDGGVRFQGDYRDARDSHGNDPEVGIGKLYYSDGTLKFEWKMTKSERIGFKKSYNRNGELVLQINFDENGNVIQ